MTTITAEARLLEAGWQCPDPALATVIRQREALRVAMARLRPLGEAGDMPIGDAILAADPEAILAAIDRHIRGQYLDANLGRPEGLITEWSKYLEDEFLKGAFRSADAILASTQEADPDARNLRHIATAETESRNTMAGGQWVSQEPPKVGFSAIIPR